MHKENKKLGCFLAMIFALIIILGILFLATTGEIDLDDPIILPVIVIVSICVAFFSFSPVLLPAANRWLDKKRRP